MWRALPVLLSSCLFPSHSIPQVWTPLYLLSEMRSRQRKTEQEKERQEKKVGTQDRDEGSKRDTGKGSISSMRPYTIKLNSCSQSFHSFLLSPQRTTVSTGATNWVSVMRVRLCFISLQKKWNQGSKWFLVQIWESKSHTNTDLG